MIAASSGRRCSPTSRSTTSRRRRTVSGDTGRREAGGVRHVRAPIPISSGRWAGRARQPVGWIGYTRHSTTRPLRARPRTRAVVSAWRRSRPGPLPFGSSRRGRPSARPRVDRSRSRSCAKTVAGSSARSPPCSTCSTPRSTTSTSAPCTRCSGSPTSCRPTARSRSISRSRFRRPTSVPLALGCTPSTGQAGQEVVGATARVRAATTRATRHGQIYTADGDEVGYVDFGSYPSR